MHKAEPEPLKPEGIDREADRGTIDEEVTALVRSVIPGQDLDEGGLAGTVLTHQGMDLAGVDVDADIAEGAGGAKRLREMPDRHDRRCCAHRTTN